MAGARHLDLLQKAALLLVAGPACFLAFTYLLKVVLGLPLLLLFPSPSTALAVNLFATCTGLLAAALFCKGAWHR